MKLQRFMRKSSALCISIAILISTIVVSFSVAAKEGEWKTVDFATLTENKLKYADNNFKNYLLCDSQGLEIRKFSNGEKYLGVSKEYAKTATKDTKPYAMYSISPGSWPEFKVTRNAKKCKTMGKNWEVIFYTSTDGKEWIEKIIDYDESKGGLEKVDLYTFFVPENVKFIKIEFPHSGLVNGDDGSDYIGIMSIKVQMGDFEFDPYGKYSFENKLNYMDKKKFSTTAVVTGDEISVLKAYSANSEGALYHKAGSGVYPTKEFWQGKESVTEKPGWISYQVKPGTAFQAEFSFNQNTIDLVEGILGDYMPKLYLSSDHNVWNECEYDFCRITTSSTNTSLTKKRASAILTIKEIPEEMNFVKFEFPIDGDLSKRTNGAYTKVGHDQMELAKVSFTSSKAIYDFNTYPEDTLIYEDYVVNELFMYDLLGLHVVKLSDDKTYLAASEKFAANATKSKMPYVIYNILANCDIKLVVTRNEDKCKAMGEDWNIKLFESTDGVEWEEISITPTISDGGLGKLDTYSFTVKSDKTFIKILYPQDGSVPGEDGSGYIGIKSIESIFIPRKFDPFGDHQYESIYNYYDAVKYPSSSEVAPAIFESLGVYGSDYGKPLSLASGIGIRPSWSYWNGKGLTNRAGWLTYHVKPDTAFQAEFSFNRKNFELFESMLGDYMPKLYISNNGGEWEEYCNSFYKLNKGSIVSNTAAAILTIDEVPKGINYVKFEFPIDGDLSKRTEKKYPYVGNDQMALVQVKLTHGTEIVPPDDGETDIPTGQIKNIDFANAKLTDYPDIGVWGMEYSKKYGMVMPSASYFENAGTVERTKPFLVIPVKPGTTFSAEVDARPSIVKSFAPGEFDAKLYTSSDGKTWNDVTKTAATRGEDGVEDFEICDRYKIMILPSDVNFIKLEMPNTRAYTGYKTSLGFEIKTTGNEYIGISRLAYTSPEEYGYEHSIDYTTLYNKYEKGIASSVDETNKEILGIYDYTNGAFSVNAFEGNVNGEAGNRYLMQVKSNYIIGFTKIEPAYVTYNIKPNTAFEAVLYASDNMIASIDPSMFFKAYVSADGTDWNDAPGIWSYNKNGELTLETKIRFVIKNVGADINYLKIVFPEYGDLAMLYPEKTTSIGNGMFGLESIKATLASYDGNYTPIDYSDMYSFENEVVKEASTSYVEGTPEQREVTTIVQTPTKEKIVTQVPVKKTKRIAVPMEIPWGLIIGCSAAGLVVIAGVVFFIVKKKKAKKSI